MKILKWKVTLAQITSRLLRRVLGHSYQTVGAVASGEGKVDW